MFFFKKNKQYSKVIQHEDWREDDMGYGDFLIPAKEHRLGKRPLVAIVSPEGCSYSIVQPNGDVLIRRGLKMYLGTPFPVTVNLTR